MRDPLPEGPEAREQMSAALRSVVETRAAVRKVYGDLRKAIAEASSESIERGGPQAFFVAECLIPRLQALVAALNAAVRGYMQLEMGGGDDDALLSREERKRSKEIYQRSRLSAVALLRLRLRDVGSRFMYGLKAARFAFQMAALWAAQRAYVEAYDSAVLAKQQRATPSPSLTDAPIEPPDLALVLCIFLGIDAMVQLFTLLFLVVLSHLFVDRRDPRSRAFVIDDEFLSSFLSDYFVTTVAIGALGLLVARLMRRKRYFDLTNMGPRTARAYCVVLAGASAVVGAVPVFLL